MKPFATILIAVLLAACKEQSGDKASLPSAVYHYAKIDTAVLANRHSVYVPVYSHIYHESGSSVINLAATLSIRNTSYADSFYITRVVYYGSQGEVLKNYLDSSIVLRPLHSVEFVVERSESRGGAGANFVVQWGSSSPKTEPLIQTVMSETGSGLSFVCNGVEMK